MLEGGIAIDWGVCVLPFSFFFFAFEKKSVTYIEWWKAAVAAKGSFI